MLADNPKPDKARDSASQTQRVSCVEATGSKPNESSLNFLGGISAIVLYSYPDLRRARWNYDQKLFTDFCNKAHKT